jgi:hypothetical protein
LCHMRKARVGERGVVVTVDYGEARVFVGEDSRAFQGRQSRRGTGSQHG